MSGRCARLAGCVLLLGACEEPVLQAFNESPFVVITKPNEDVTVAFGSTVELLGKVADDGSVLELKAAWIDNGADVLAGDLVPDREGLVSLSVADLDVGAHAIMLRATDPAGLFGDATVTITVERAVEAPSLTIVRPGSTDRGAQDQPFTYEATVSDGQDPPEELVVEVTSDLDGLQCTTNADEVGNAVCQGTPRTQGAHELTFVVTDSDGNQTTRRTALQVQPVKQEPTLTVVSPLQGANVSAGASTALEVTVSDAQDPPEVLKVAVTSDRDGGVCAMTADTSGSAACFAILTSFGAHTLTFVVTDTDGNTASGVRLVNAIDPRDVDDDRDGETENEGDCDDTDDQVGSRAPERPNGKDDNCNGVADEGTVNYDDDGDGYCESPTGCTDGSTPGDCDDTKPGVNPGATETCATPYDDDCDVDANDVGAAGCTTWFIDGDGDNYGLNGTEICTCTAPPGGVRNGGDCNDANPGISPARTDVENGFDDNCDGRADEGTPRFDNDGDGYCAASNCTTQPDGTTPLPNDCNDGRIDVNPGRVEVCGNGVDDNCAGGQDEGENNPGCLAYYTDADNDGFGGGVGRCLCKPDGDYKTRNASDCYDNNINAYPGQPDFFDVQRGDGSFDYDCDGVQTPLYDGEYECECTVRLNLGPFTIPVRINDFTAGWENEPACGQTGRYYLECKNEPITVEDTGGVGISFCLPGLSEIARTATVRQSCR